MGSKVKDPEQGQSPEKGQGQVTAWELVRGRREAPVACGSSSGRRAGEEPGTSVICGDVYRNNVQN